MTYQDALSAPTYERRFFLSTLINENNDKREKMEEKMQESKTSTGKGTRTTTVSGKQLKSQLKTGQIPN